MCLSASKGSPPDHLQHRYGSEILIRFNLMFLSLTSYHDNSFLSVALNGEHTHAIVVGVRWVHGCLENLHSPAYVILGHRAAMFARRRDE